MKNHPHLRRLLPGTITPFFHSLRLRLLALVTAFIALAMTLLGAHTLFLFEQAATLQLEHEGLLLSDTPQG